MFLGVLIVWKNLFLWGFFLCECGLGFFYFIVYGVLGLVIYEWCVEVFWFIVIYIIENDDSLRILKERGDISSIEIVI